MRRQTAEARAAATRAAAEAQDLGSYRLSKRLGAGGMGEVWRAEHRLLARQAAIKLIRPDGDTGPEAQERFRREAQTLATLRSRNTIELFDYGITDDGTFFYVMELLDGMDLENLLLRYGPQRPARVCSLLIQACSSLAEAHASGLVHRDIKPANIWLRLPLQGGQRFEGQKHRDPAQTPPLSSVVIDFGMVRNVKVAPDASGRFVAGTAGYIAPEQVLDPVELDPRSDVYALAGTIYNVTTGRAFFDEFDNQRDRIIAHMRRDPFESAERLQSFPPAIAKLLREATAINPADRPSPLEFGRAFAAGL
jgi:serine/threonine-protein kinase